jgi:guanyl-specific ribonuclease Sa
MLSHARLSILSNVVRNYSATTAAESTAAESAATAVESTTGAASSTVSTAAVESTVDSLLAALLPQDAKDTAANATNKNTNFFIFFAF